MASLRDLTPATRDVAAEFIRILESPQLARLARLRGPIRVTVTSTRRSRAKQAQLYADYKAGRSKYPAAAPGQSLHGLGVAFDLHLDPPAYELAGAIWERLLGFRWGGHFADPIHFDTRPRV